MTPVECGVHLMNFLNKHLIPAYFHAMPFPLDNVWRLQQQKDMPQKQYQHYLEGQKVIGDFYKYDPKVPIFSDWEMFAALLVKYLQWAIGSKAFLELLSFSVKKVLAVSPVGDLFQGFP